MIEPELVTTVIPARNAAATLAQTLDSLLAQTAPRWRALIVDDGSTDATGAIIAAYAARDQRFMHLSGPKAGVSRARNTALPFAQGRWLHCLDADDWVAPEFYEKMLDLLAATPDAVAGYCGYRRVMADDGITWMYFLPEIAENPPEMFARFCGLHIAGLLLDRAAVRMLGGFDPALATCEDWDLFQRLARLGRRWVGLAEPLAFYRASASSLSRNLAQLETDALRVIDRGFRADERLAGLPLAHPGGAAESGGARDLAVAKVAAWIAAQRCFAGDSFTPDLRVLRPLPKFSADNPFMADTVLECLMLSARVTADKLADLWPSFAEGVTKLIRLLGDVWEDAGAAHDLQLRLEEEILDFDDLAAPRLLGFTFGLRVDMARPATIKLPPGVERVYAYLMRGDQIHAIQRFPATDQVTRRRWLELMLARFEPSECYKICRARHPRLLRCHRLFHTAAAVARRPRLLWRREEMARQQPDFQRAALLSLSA